MYQKSFRKKIIASLKTSHYFSLMADKATDISSKEELSVCARWLENNKPVKHFLGIVHAKEIMARGITSDLYTFLDSKCIDLQKTRGLGFDEASAMSGHRTGVQTGLRLHSLSSIYMQCWCHQLQLAVLKAAGEHYTSEASTDNSAYYMEGISLLSKES